VFEDFSAIGVLEDSLLSEERYTKEEIESLEEWMTKDSKD